MANSAITFFLAQPVILAIVTLIILDCSAQRQVFSAFEGPGEGGNSVTFVRKVPDLSNYTNILAVGQVKSYCCTGWWKDYSEKNYNGSTGVDWICQFEQQQCVDQTMWYSGSIRHLGPADLSTVPISLYQGVNHEGEEVVVSYAQEPAISFHPESAFITGNSNWTLFENANFSGPSVCYESTQSVELIAEINYFSWDIYTIGSIKRGCEDTCVSWKTTKRVTSLKSDGKVESTL